MPLWLALSLLVGAIVLFALGTVLVVLARRGENPSDPLKPTLNWRKWKPVWTMRSRFLSDRTFHLYAWGSSCWSAGGMLLLIYLVASWR